MDTAKLLPSFQKKLAILTDIIIYKCTVMMYLMRYLAMVDIDNFL
jgi:hypothetical protein